MPSQKITKFQDSISAEHKGGDLTESNTMRSGGGISSRQHCHGVCMCVKWGGWSPSRQQSQWEEFIGCTARIILSNFLNAPYLIKLFPKSLHDDWYWAIFYYVLPAHSSISFLHLPVFFFSTIHWAPFHFALCPTHFLSFNYFYDIFYLILFPHPCWHFSLIKSLLFPLSFAYFQVSFQGILLISRLLHSCQLVLSTFFFSFNQKCTASFHKDMFAALCRSHSYHCQVLACSSTFSSVWNESYIGFEEMSVAKKSRRIQGDGELCLFFELSLSLAI